MTNLKMTSTAFEEGAAIPTKHSCDGADRSPALRWDLPPRGTASLALLCDDPDAPGRVWVHWVLYGVAPETTELAEGVPATESLADGARQGRNDFGNIGYGGPCPPRGKPHRYYFKLYALDAIVDLPSGATKAQLLDAIKGHIIAEGSLMGTYQRR